MFSTCAITQVPVRVSQSRATAQGWQALATTAERSTTHDGGDPAARLVPGDDGVMTLAGGSIRREWISGDPPRGDNSGPEGQTTVVLPTLAGALQAPTRFPRILMLVTPEPRHPGRALRLGRLAGDEDRAANTEGFPCLVCNVT